VVTTVTLLHMAPRSCNPNTSAWLKASRAARGWKQDDVVARLRDLEVEVGRSWLSRIENGEPFSDELLAAFVTLYESAPPEPPAEPASPPAPADLASALVALAQELAALRAERREMTDRMRDLEATVGLLVSQGPLASGTAARPAPAPPRATAGSDQ
jgi:transcriptional regulator with XRE-family HTH domain